MNLTDLANKFGSDKGNVISERHEYTLAYEKFISKNENKIMLEIGLAEGASTMMWQSYNSNMKNVVIDITKNHMKNEYEEIFKKNNNVIIEIGDQSDVVFLNKIATQHGPFDYIIDDGSHFQDHIQISFSVLFEHLKPEGLYFIEDLHVHNSKRYCRTPGDSVITLFEYYNQTKQFNSQCVDNKILNRFSNQIKSLHLYNNKLLIIEKIKSI